MCNKVFVKGIISLLFTLYSVTSYSQLRLSNDKLVCDSCSSNILFEFSSANFIKNNEYSSPLVSGSTGIGYFLKPGISYFINDKTKIFTGVFLQQYSGTNKFSSVVPLFNIRYRPSESITINFGSIDGSVNHGVVEPMFRFDRFYQNQIEYGLQFLYDNKFLKSDSWLNWEQFIFKNDDAQEQFQFGSVNEFVFNSGEIGLRIPFQFLFDHKGGEINISSDGVSSLINTATGLIVSYAFNEESEIRVEPLFLWYNATQIPETGVNAQVFDSGSARYIKLVLETKRLYGMLGYWNANKFIGTKGEYLFHSVAENDNEIIIKKRNLLTTKLQWKKQISPSMQWQFRFDGYYDLDSNELNHAIGLYLLLDLNLLMWKKRNS